MPYLDLVLPIVLMLILLVSVVNSFLLVSAASDARGAKHQAEQNAEAVKNTMSKFLVLSVAQARDEATLTEKQIQEEKAIIVAAARGANGNGAPSQADVAVQASALLQEAAMQAKTLLETAAVTAANLLSSATAEAGKK